jgi:type III restriction enzyme
LGYAGQSYDLRRSRSDIAGISENLPMIALCDYQEKAIRKLYDTTDELLELQGNKAIVFKAPTGSGKTVMVAEYLKELVEHRNDERAFAFIWTAPRQLHTQSKSALEKYYSDSKALRCVSFEDLIDRSIGENEILFLNWESINKADNIYIRDNERDINLSTIIQNTLDAGRTIILVIDESHFAAKTETSRELVAMFSPKIAVEVSATPVLAQFDEMINVPRESVIAEGMIKKQIAINPGFKNTITRQNAETLTFESQAAESTDEFVLRMAIKKREQLARAYQAMGANVNPLLLIQLPDKKQGEADYKDDVVKILKDKHSISLENGKLAIYLSEDKTNLENITRNDNEAEVMIFKQAIALGWDCPRASILVLFRDWQSFTFSTQTLGRILRMPETKHYADEELNTGFIFTNLSDLSIVEDMAGNYLTIQYANRTPEYQPLALRSVYSKRFREETRLTPEFIKDFLFAAKELGLKDKIDVQVDDVSMDILSDGLVVDLDKRPEHILKDAGSIGRRQNVMEIQKLFESFARESLKPQLFPEPRSIGRVRTAIHAFFKMSFPIEFTGATTRAQIITLHPKNRQFFIDTLNRAKEIYLENVGKAKKELETVDSWDVQTSRTYKHQCFERSFRKSVLQPYFEVENSSGPEKQFVEFLETTLANVEWFFRNGDSDAIAFAVPYANAQGEDTPFYVDWIVKFTDGRIGLFDTKLGITAETAKTRADGLAAYIKAENARGKNLFGGIVVFKDGSWRYNDSEDYQYEPSLKDWKFLQ